MKILTLSSVYPNPEQPVFGLFVRERMHRVHREEGVTVRVAAPVPRSPLDPLARILKPGFRPARPIPVRDDEGMKVHHPGFLSIPGCFKTRDGRFMGRSLLRFVRDLRREFPFDLVDAHFGYPEGAAAAYLAERVGVPFTVTFRGTEARYARDPRHALLLKTVVRSASRVIAVSESLGKVAKDLGCPGTRIRVVPNGVDTDRFTLQDRTACRKHLEILGGGPVLVTVGSLVERKGFHRVIELLPSLKKRFPGLVYLAVGGGSAEGDYRAFLEAKAAELGVADVVRFTGARPPAELPAYYGAADAFVLSTRNEGCCNAIMESLACGTPVVATDVGGNREMVSRPELGRIVPFGEAEALRIALEDALETTWEPEILAAHARKRSWEAVASEVIALFEEILNETRASERGASSRNPEER